MTDFDGTIWVAQNGDEINFICLLKREKNNQLQALSEKSKKLSTWSEDKLLWQHPKRASTPEDWSAKLANIQAKVEMLSQTIELSLLWESARELQMSEMDDLADLYFGGEITTEHLAAIWKTLAQDRLHFKRRGKLWEARSIEQVEELKQQRKQEQNRTQEKSMAKDWLKKMAKLPVSSGFDDDSEDLKLLAIPPGLTSFVERLEAWLLRGNADKFVEELVRSAAEEHNFNPRELAFESLLKTGRLPPEAERDVIVAGLKPEFSVPVNEAAAAVKPWLPSDTQTIIDLSFSIDDAETREVDDALSIQREDDQWKITIAISDPACVVHRGDVLDREAMRRGTTVYLPTQTVLMLPAPVSCDIASLTAGQIRSAIVIRAWLNDRGELLDSKISREPIRVWQRLHYGAADEMIAQGQDTAAQQLQALFACTKQLHAQRLAEGAFNLPRPEFKVSVHEGNIKITLIERDSPSRLLVAEMMILANHIAAKYAQRHQVPIIYRSQEYPMEPITEEMLADPLGFHRARRLLRASTLSLQPGSHSGLGLSVYTQLSSPLRRFADLVIQRQLVAHLVGEPLPYDREELFRVLETAERTAREARAVEGESKKRWFMQYLRQQWLKQPLPVLIIENVKGGYKVEIQPWGVEAFLATPNQSLEFGATVTAVIDKIQMKTAYARLKLA